MESLARDLRYAARALVHSPAFAAVAILCLALGMGVNSTVYSIVDAISIRPLPFEDAERLVRLVTTNQARGIARAGVSYPDFEDWKTGNGGAFVEMAGYSGRNLTISDGRDAERIIGGVVSWNLFPMLGVTPVLGRPFSAADDRPGADPVALIGHDLWERRFQSDPSVIGKTVLVNGAPYAIVGILPPRFAFTQVSQIWLPLAPDQAAATRGQRALAVFARLAPDATLERAGADIAATAARLAANPENEGWSAAVIPLRDDFMPGADVQRAITTMMGAVTLVLLIACANVANLLLARATVRHREIAVRTALGAGRWRIVRQMLTESVLLALASAPFGVLIALVGLRWITASVPEQIPYYIDWSLNWRVVAYTGIAAVTTGIVFGLAPALNTAGSDLHRSLKEGGRSGGGSVRRNRLRSALVVAEIALSFVLLVGASLFVRSFANLRSADAGIDSAPLMTMRFFMTGERYGEGQSRVDRVEDIVRRVEALPAVEAMFASNFVPHSGGGNGDTVQIADAPFEAGREPEVTYFGVTAGVRRTLGIPLVGGRDFEAHESFSRSAVAIVNRALAERLWPDAADVIGRQFRLVSTAPNEWFTIVGLVDDFRPWNVRDESTPALAFVPYPYQPSPFTGLTIKVRGTTPASITPAVREEIRKSDALLPLYDVRTGDENVALNYWDDRILSFMFAIFGGIALLLAWIGIYGVLSYSVVQRTQEIGIRMAIGAGRGDVFRLVLGHGARLVAIGVALGLVGAAAVTRIVQNLLYNVGALDPLSFVGMAAVLAAAVLLASYVPARRATTVDPLVALRME